MFELLSLLLGGGLRLLPEVFKIFTAKKDADHEYRMTQLQLEIDKARATQALDQVAAKGAMEQAILEMQGLVKAQERDYKPTGIAWIDAISQSIRPFLTYWWCVVIYSTAKAMSVLVAVQSNASIEAMTPIIMTDFDRSVIGSMISYWFMDRSLRKMQGGR